jgi:hypothetical protein
LYCKRCKKEVEIEIKDLEPKSQDWKIYGSFYLV